MTARALVVLAAVVVAGCGSGGGAATAGPSATATAAGTPFPVPTPVHLRPRIAPAQARQLDAGAVGVIGFDLQGAVAPSRLMVNKEQTLQGVRWSGWGGPSATGRAQVRTLVCDPDCAQGRLEYSSGTIVLSGQRRCGRRRFYTAGRMTYLDPDTRRTRAPSVFLWPPC